MRIYNSKPVISLQDDIHENLLKYIQRYSLTNYQRPLRDISSEHIIVIKNWLNNENFILDLGCGVGESCYQLAKKHPGKKILGIDKSLSRVERKNDFKVENKDILILRDDVLDLVPLLLENFKGKIDYLYILYPNPWPKKTQLKRRFHANPIAPFLMELSNKITLRSNWKVYLKEFNFACEYYKKRSGELREVELKNEFLTPFEKKYSLSDQSIFELEINLDI